MNRIQRLVNGVALILVLGGVGVGLAEEKPGKPQDSPQTSMIGDLWRQMGQVQRQIVGLEVRDVNPRAIPRSQLLPGNIVQASPENAPQQASGRSSGDIQKSGQAQKTLPGQEPPPQLRDSTNEAQIDQLWRQITELQKTILKLEIADTSPRLLASAAPAVNRNDRTETPNTASARNPDRASGSGPNREKPQKPIPGLDNPLPRGGSNEAHVGQLWQQIGQLYRQIVALEVRGTSFVD